jgi:Ulp1 family protease
MQVLLDDRAVLTVLVPVNFGKEHWCALIIDKVASTIIMYDSTNAERYKSVLENFADDIHKTTKTTKFKNEHSANPQQFDGWNCGLYVCKKMWYHVDEHARKETETYGHFTLRFVLMNYILNGNIV